MISNQSNMASALQSLIHRLGPLVLIGLSLNACGQQKSVREQLNAQNSADFQAKYEDLSAAEGTFKGNMHLIASDQDFVCIVALRREVTTEPSPDAETPSETTQIAKLRGYMTFPVLEQLPLEDYAGFLPLLGPMGTYDKVAIQDGDFDPTFNKQLVLPYTVPKYSGNFGTLTGPIDGDQFTGSWYANEFGNVGTFTLNRISGTGGQTP